MYGKSHQEPKLSDTVVMLPPVLPGCAVELQIKTEWRIRRTRSAVVNCSRFREEDHAFAGQVKAITPIDVFSIHEELGVQEANPLERIPLDHKKPSI